MTRFNAEKISDQKRIARGNQLLVAQARLRARDQVHHAPWRVLILPGLSPEGEVKAIRELMPKSHITAIDRDATALAAAIDAGVNEVVQADLTAFELVPSKIAGSTYIRKGPSAALRALQRFDLIHLDLCTNPNETTKRIFALHWELLAPRGVFIGAFSYGRDVVEVSIEAGRKSSSWLKWLTAGGVPAHLASRLVYLFSKTHLYDTRSIICYAGNEMPMCSVLFSSPGPGDPPSFIRLDDGDFERMVLHPDVSLLYDCPRDRIEAIRRRHAALKAVQTRTLRASATKPKEKNIS